MKTFEMLTGNILAIHQDAETVFDPTVGSGSGSTFVIHQTVSVVYTPAPVPVASNKLNLTQSVKVQLVLNLKPSSYFQPQQGSVRFKDFYFNQLLHFTQSARLVEWNQVVQQLFFSQLATASRSLNNTLTLTQSVNVSCVFNQSVTDVLAFESDVAYWEDKYNFIAAEVAPSILAYVPQDPENVDPLWVVQIPPQPSVFSKVTLTYNAETITLSVPQFGDTDSIEHQRINRTTRDLDLIIYRDPKWPINERWKMKFTKLSQITGKTLLSFLSKTVGKPMEMVDFEGVKWTVFVLNPDAKLIQVDRKNGCDQGLFEVELEFQGKQHA